MLTHGDKGRIYAKDFGYPPDMLWTPFTGDKCPTLAGKPKMFFIQACRGTKVDSGARAIFISRDSGSATYSIPSMADILVMYSTYEGKILFNFSLPTITDFASFRLSLLAKSGDWFMVYTVSL